ncbi:hypothetical protein ASPZODRAFT_170422 [Penicilliopsis zonata CBS 506.65]|uniref:Uncharacterized protein n=1 Tax=Penicilliopsis zonata CBS 506.65 TaxID=1073090 RepID=A0A1L9S4F9_9EURO|nr:hypothetical protein ASPZODRAFT_170422 [Penicilliopsis zonata CBS 506.65]OJJ42045.1 hypothetical protein ASPZODRAFT_170422 [Penicilliopsis zonata CBS 506.65]
MSTEKERLQCPSLFKTIPDLKSAIEGDLFFEGGSHDALHFFLEALKDDNTDPFIKMAIKNTFRDPSVRQRIEESWKLSYDYHDEKIRQHRMGDEACYDLASWCFKNCSLCSNGLLDNKMIQPSSYFFWLAFSSGKGGLSQSVLSLVDPESLLVPFSTGKPNEVQRTMFTWAILVPKCFEICWERLKPLRETALGLIGPTQKRSILGYADVELAERLRKDGLDLGNLEPEHPSLVLLETLSGTDPDPMFKWLLDRGLQPPEDLLMHATESNYIAAARWLMSHGNYSQSWRNAALKAAGSTDQSSAELMSIIVEGAAAELPKDAKLSQDLVIEVVDRACQEKEKFNAIRSVDISQQVADMEHLAVRKIEALGKAVGKVEVIGTKIKAEEAKLDGLLQALGDMDLRS